MTAYKIINRISSVALVAASLLITPALTGCSSEADPVPAPEPSPAGDAIVNLSISAPTSVGTRADNGSSVQPTDAELTVDKIYVIFYSVDKTEPTKDGTFWKSFEISSATAASDVTMTFPTDGKLPSGDESDANTGTYQQVLSGINIPSGDYRIYALANIDGISISNDSKQPSETTLLNKSLTISGSNLTYKTGDKLPLFANPKTHSTSNTVVVVGGSASVDNSNGIVTLGSGSNTIKLTMTYQVAKVQLSIVYDNSVGSCSYPYNSFQITSGNAKNLNISQTLGSVVSSYATHNNFPNLGLGLTPYKLPADWDFENPTTVASEAETTVTGWNATVSAPTLYQGTFYLPEARYTENKPYVELTATAGSLGNGTNQTETKIYTIGLPDQVEEVSDEHTLTRGHYYDVVARITPSGLQFNVRVRKWQNFDRDAFEL